MNKLNENSKRSMTTRIITAIVMIAVLIPGVILGGWFIFAIAIFLIGASIYEVYKSQCVAKNNIFVIILMYIFGFVFLFYPWFTNLEALQSMFTTGEIYLTSSDFRVSAIALIVFALILFFISFIDKELLPPQIGYLVMMTFLVCLGIFSLGFIRFLPSTREFGLNLITYNKDEPFGTVVLNNNIASCLLFCFVLIATMMSDVGAYFTGVLFGKHKMTPNLSPNKTWEGFFGGIFISMAVSLSFAALFEFGFGLPLLPNIICFQNNEAYGQTFFAQPFWFILLISFVAPIISVFGDLLFSRIKRHYGFKDYGKVFPGHGGVLDRFDSSIVTFPVISLIIIMIIFLGVK